MREAGIILLTHVEVDPNALGIGLEALLMIELSKHNRSIVDEFPDDIIDLPEVRSGSLISGRYDLIVHVVVRDTQHLTDLVFDQFTIRPGVTRI